MNTLSIRLRYRPLRLGWCVANGDMESFRRALRLSYTLWGGCSNPVIPVDDFDHAAALVRLFRVDALVGLSQGAATNLLMAKHKHLPWPMFTEGLFVNSMSNGKVANVVDIRHPLTRLYDEFFRNNPSPEPGLDIYQWECADPLADVFLCSYGAYPPAEETGEDYAALAQTSLLGVPYIIPDGGELAVPHIGRATIATLCQTYIDHHYAVRNDKNWPGFYVGGADCFDDLVTFWNLRAADIPLQFLDMRYIDRLGILANAWADQIRKAPASPYGPQGLAVWHRLDDQINATLQYLDNTDLVVCRVSDATWNGLDVRAPIVYFSDASVLASVDEGGKTPKISFALPDKPFTDRTYSNEQHYVLSVDPGIGLFRNERATLHLPFLPELNEYYGRDAHILWNVARSEPDALGIVTSISTEHESLRAVSVQDLVAQIFQLVGIEAAPSKSGLVASTLIRQMGGLEGCRPFKIAGVRTLIEKHRPDQSFSRGTAMQTIMGQGKVRRLADYQRLYIEPRAPGAALTNDAVLAYLLERGVFRAGLRFACPSCQLEFWRSLDEARSRLDCDFCGHTINVTPQLRDKDWAFRRSGLFGQDDSQQGAIPVLLTLQQLKRVSGTSDGIFTTAMCLAPKGAAIHACETDFVVVNQRGGDQRIEVVIGECKTRQRMTADDVANLKAVAEAFPVDRFDVYVVFARLDDFSVEEIDLIKVINGPHRRRAIMFTARELEPYMPYERTAEIFDIQETIVNLADMAAITARVFLGE